MIVATLTIVLVILLIWSIYYGRNLVRTEKTDAVFGNPSRALGGWHWVIAGITSIMLIWLYFSWDIARAFIPMSGNELCQVAKLNRTVNPIRANFPLDSRLLRGTLLLQRDREQIQLLQQQLDEMNFAPDELVELRAIIEAMDDVLTAQTDPTQTDPRIAAQFDDIATRISHLVDQMSAPNYPGKPNATEQARAMEQPDWGASTIELPVLPMTDRGRKFAAASLVMQQIAKDYTAIRNNSTTISTQLAEIRTRYQNFVVPPVEDATIMAQHKRFIRQIDKIYKRIDDGKIFPPSLTQAVEAALIRLDHEQYRQQGMLFYIDSLIMPGGTIMAGNSACSEQGAGRWLPKPSDTFKTFLRLADPAVGYKGTPLLWYEMRPVAEIIAWVVPDWLPELMPGEYPRHNSQGVVVNNVKSKVYNFATGNYDSLSVPVPIGHIWDSVVRVLAGLLLGIIFGVPLGLFMGLSRFAKGYFDPLIELYRPVPPLAWAPLVLTIFGIHDDGKIFLLFMVAFAIMVISARTGATGTQLSKVHAAHSLGASKWQILRQVILPNSLPEILTGIRIAIGVCWGTLVAAEMLAGTTGIGFVENVARKQSDYEIIWVTIILLGVLGLLFDLIMRWVIARSIPWRGKG
jgi:taurine transport system permease protein